MAAWKQIVGIFIFELVTVVNTASARFYGMDPSPVNPDDPRTFNRYSYANNNPYRFVDPNGKDAVVANGNIKIIPVVAGVPSVTISNTVGAKGFSSSEILFHKYSFTESSGLSLSQAGEGIKNNPTPGNDNPASPGGTSNDAGFIPFSMHNIVKSFSVSSPDAKKFSDITVNYTVSGAHTLNEGFVMRYGEVGADGKTMIRTYGEGNSLKQIIPGATSYAGQAWSGVNKEINNISK